MVLVKHHLLDSKGGLGDVACAWGVHHVLGGCTMCGGMQQAALKSHVQARVQALVQARGTSRPPRPMSPLPMPPLHLGAQPAPHLLELGLQLA